MSRSAQPFKGMTIEALIAAVTAAVTQVLATREPKTTVNISFVVSPVLAQTDILDSTSCIGAKIFSKATESLQTTFQVDKPNMRILINELQMRSETYG
jgi:phenylpyruvate tautomerase PptA (4-oxalocrotonate tautomerase family)